MYTLVVVGVIVVAVVVVAVDKLTCKLNACISRDQTRGKTYGE